jgi:hypothetical protein
VVEVRERLVVVQMGPEVEVVRVVVTVSTVVDWHSPWMDL